MEISAKEIVLVVICLFNFLIGLFVFVQQPKRLVHQAFCLATIGISTWGIGLILLAQTQMFQPFDKVTIYGFLLFLFGFVLFARVFPNSRQVAKKFWLVFIPLGFLVIITPFNLIIRTAIFHVGSEIQPVNGPLFPVFAIILVCYILFGIALFIRTYRKSSGRARLQVQYLLFGLSIFLGTTIIFDILLPMLGVFELNFLGPISSIVLTGITAYTIVRHQLLDIRVVIQRSLIYTILLTTIIGVYIIAFQFLGYILHQTINTTAIISAGSTMVLGVFFMQPLKEYFQKVTDHIFFKDGYKYAEALHELSHIMYTSLNQEDIVSRSQAILKNIFKTDFVEIIFEEHAYEEVIQEDEYHHYLTLVRPIMFNNKTIGLLRLGPKRSGDAYTKQDIQLISTFTFSCAIAIGKARLHAQVEEYTLHLEQLVQDRTGEIKKLQEDQKQTMIDISHNLQTPLAVIRGEVELLDEFSADTEKMHSVKKSLDRVSVFIRQLLHLARLDYGVYTYSLVPVDVADLLREQIDYFEVMADAQGIRFTTTVLGSAEIVGDTRLLQELFTNIVLNAITYRRTGIDSVISIRLIETEAGYEVEIEDNGIGIAEEDLENIFIRFHRASNASHTLQGTGLGLAIAKKIVEKHAGTISVESTLGEKTIFKVFFPKSERV